MQLAAAALAVGDQTLHKSAGFERGEDEMRIDVNRERRDVALHYVLVNAISAGGGVVSMVLSKESK